MNEIIKRDVGWFDHRVYDEFDSTIDFIRHFGVAHFKLLKDRQHKNTFRSPIIGLKQDDLYNKDEDSLKKLKWWGYAKRLKNFCDSNMFPYGLFWDKMFYMAKEGSYTVLTIKSVLNAPSLRFAMSKINMDSEIVYARHSFYKPEFYVGHKSQDEYYTYLIGHVSQSILERQKIIPIGWLKNE